MERAAQDKVKSENEQPRKPEAEGRKKAGKRAAQDKVKPEKDRSGIPEPEAYTAGNGASWRGTTRLLLMVALLAIGLTCMWVYWPAFRWLVASIVVIFGLTGVYPLTYVAYLSFRAKAQRERLKDDFRILGLEDEDKLEQTVEKLYQTVYSPTQFVAYILLIIVNAVLILAGYLERDALGSIEAETMALMFYAFLGAYIFSVQELVRRYNTFDLRPQVYSSILVRMLVAVVVVFVGASVIAYSGGQLASTASDMGTQPQPWAAVLAFLIGVFPRSGTHWLGQQAKPVFSSPGIQAAELPLRNILGVSTWHESRLAEMGIDDVQNLAAADIRKLLLTTQFDTQQIVNWIDQAILYVKVGAKIDRFREANIHTFHEFRLFLNERLLSFSLHSGGQADAAEQHEEAQKRLAVLLGMSNPDQLDRLGDHSGFPNYAYLLEYYKHAARLAHERATAGLERLIGALQQTEYELAVEDGLSLLRQHPDDAEVWTSLGTAYYRLGAHDQAYEAYTRALDLDNNLARAYYSRSMIYILRGEYDRAIQDCTNAILIDRTQAKAYNNRGLAYMHLGYPDQALADLDEALSLDERLAVAYNNRALTYNAQGDFEDATRDFELAYLLGFREVGLWLGWGIALIGVEQYEDAIRKLSKAVLYETNLARAYEKRGYAYLCLGEGYYPQAKRNFKQAISLNDGLVSAHSNLGLLEVGQGNYEQAIDHYTRALEIDEHQFVTRYNRAVAYFRLNRIADARADFGRVADSAPPDSVEAREAQLWLSGLEAAEEENEAEE
jgi:tetratricopeptide (TPR) repeat protein